MLNNRTNKENKKVLYPFYHFVHSDGNPLAFCDCGEDTRGLIVSDQSISVSAPLTYLFQPRRDRKRIPISLMQPCSSAWASY